MIWEEIVKTALLGTERTKLSATTLQHLESLGVDTDVEETTILLQAAALLHQQQRVALPFADFAGELPERVANDNLRVCSVLSAYHLQLILDGTFGGVLREFIFCLNENQKELPPELLPDLLEQSLKNDVLYQQLEPALGERGKWLIQQNPGWQKLAQNDDPETWLTGRPNERIALIRYLRQNAPELAITLIESTWQQESLANKLTFLKLLKTGLSATDEAFLEQQSDNGRKEIRAIAADLLANLPTSALVGRMYQRVEECLYFQSEQLIIELPEDFTDDELRDGILPNANAYRGGLRASHFGQLLERVPPELWEIYLQRDATQCLQLFLRTDWRTTVLPALIKATARFKNATWAEAIIRYWLKTEEQDIWQNTAVKRIIPLLSAKNFNEICVTYIELQNELIGEESVVVQLLLADTHPWENSLTTALIMGFQRWLNTTDNYLWNTWHYRELLQVASTRADVNLFQQLKSGWRFSTAGQIRWEKEIEGFLRTLIFRRDMITELKK
ncbi:MAG: DUF5691 domain-containing protein [Saprospiraceae bacterium]